MLPERVENKLEATFSRPDLANARKLLPGPILDQAEVAYVYGLLRLIKLSEGDMERLQYFANRAREFPTDVLLLWTTPGPSSEWPKDLKEMLQGGPVTIAEHAPQPPVDLEDDLLERSLVDCGPLRCIVCGTKIDAGYVYLSRIDLNATPRRVSAGRVSVHQECRATGAALAREQGYGWTNDMPDLPKESEFNWGVPE